jgi:hypothetical protein
MMEFRLSQSLSYTFFSRWNFDYQGAFSWWNFAKHIIWGKTLFIYIAKSIYIGSASLKTLPLDLEPPLQEKEYGPPYSKLIAKFKHFLYLKPLIDPWFGLFTFSRNLNLRKKNS